MVAEFFHIRGSKILLIGSDVEISLFICTTTCSSTIKEYAVSFGIMTICHIIDDVYREMVNASTQYRIAYITRSIMPNSSRTSKPQHIII